MGTAIATTPLASPSVLKSPIFAAYNGALVPRDESCDVSLYLPTQTLSVTERKIIAPGAISLRLQGGNIVITDAVGGAEEILRRVIALEMTIPLDLISRNNKLKPPASNLEEAEFVASWFIRRGLACAEEVAGEYVEVEALKATTNITAREFIEGATGRAFVYFTARTNKLTDRTVPAWFDWKKNKMHYRIGVVVERSPNGEIAAIAWLKENEDLISEECRKPKLPGEDFCNLDYPLGGFLRKLQKIFSVAAKSTKKKAELIESELSFWQLMLKSEGAGEEKSFDAEEWKFLANDNQSVYVNAVIVDEESGLFLFVHKYDDGKPSWGLPGGGREPGETAEDSLFREVEWESGLRIYRGCINKKLIGVRKIIERQVNARHKRITFYSPLNSRIFKPSMRGVKERNEIDKVRLFSLDEFLRMPYFPWDRSAADPNIFDYRKQLHTDDVITTLRLTGKLGQLGFREATREEIVKFALAA